MVSAADFIKECYIPLNEGWGYIYGQWGAIWTAEKQAKATREMTVKYGSKWIGKHVTDCSGLLRWALDQLGEKIVHHARYQYTDYSKPKGKLVNGLREDGTPPLPGTAVFLQGNQDKIHHVGVYVGNGVCIEAKGTIYGVVTSELSHWDHWGMLKMVDYTDAEKLEGQDFTPAPVDTVLKAEATNPGRYLNVRSGPGAQYSKQFTLTPGTIVDVLTQEPEWWQIKSGGRIGWAFAQYLTPLEPEEPEQTEDGILLTPEDLNVLIQCTNSLNDLLAKIGGYVG